MFQGHHLKIIALADLTNDGSKAPRTILTGPSLVPLIIFSLLWFQYWFDEGKVASSGTHFYYGIKTEVTMNVPEPVAMRRFLVRTSISQKEMRFPERTACNSSWATGWLEPCREFLEAAHQADQMAAEENLESQKEFLKKIGSNFRLAARTLRFDYRLPWRLVAATADFSNLWRRPESNRRPKVID